MTITSDISTETFAEKTIYFALIEFLSMTKTINFVVQTTIDRSMNTMFVKMQNMINQIRVQFSTFSFFSFNNFEKSMTTNNNFFNSRFMSKKLNFFDFKYDDKTTFIDDSMKNTNEKIVYRDVHVFINRTKNFVVIFEIEMIRINLYRCMKENALT